MRIFIGLLTLIIWEPLLGLPTPEATKSGSDFSASMEAVHSHMQSKNWVAARSTLLAALEKHGPTPRAMARRAEILEDWRRISLRLAVAEPAASDLISGELQYHNVRSGKIKVRYRNGNFGDFHPPSSEAPLFQHPVYFTGDHSLLLEGKSAEGVTLYVCIDEDSTYAIRFEFENRSEARATALELVGSNRQELESEPVRGLHAGKPFRIKVEVTSRSVAITANRSRVFRFDKPRNRFGSFALSSLTFIDKLTLDGRAHSSWLQGLKDQAIQSETKAFMAHQYHPEKDLPSWLFKETPSSTASTDTEDDSLNDIPFAYSETSKPVIESLLDDLEKGDDQAVIRNVRRRGSSIPPLFRDYFLSVAYFRTGKSRESLQLISGVLRSYPNFPRGLWLRAQLLIRLGRFEEAHPDLLALARRYPHHIEFRHRLIESTLWGGDLDLARRLVVEAREAGLVSDRLGELDDLTVQATRGPNWHHQFEFESDHFVVKSDIDRKTAREIGTILEKCYEFLGTFLGVSPPQRSPFRAYVFSGRAGFESYSSNLFGKPQENAAGLYSPELKQLLLWNVSDRAEVLRVARHEALHQYLDLIGIRVPTWFNEGLAGCVEYVNTGYGGELGKIRHSTLNERHLRTLKGQRASLLPLQDLLVLDHESFYQNPQLHYAQAWAFVAFLRENKGRARGIFDEIMALGASGIPAQDVVKRAIDGTSIRRLQEEFLATLDGWIKEI